MTREEFKQLRLKLGCETRRELAEQMGVTKGAIEHWEYGRRPLPTWAQKLIRCLYAVKLAEKELGVKQ